MEPTMNAEPVPSIERIIDEMDAAFSRHDLDELVALFADDATIESFLVTRIFNRQEGVCHGRAEIRQLLSAILKAGVPWTGHEPPIVRGDTAAVEFRSGPADAEKFSVDIITVKNGRIQSLRAYAGWRALAADSRGQSAPETKQTQPTR
jgi:ketosteroid isomerase-like protein